MIFFLYFCEFFGLNLFINYVLVFIVFPYQIHQAGGGGGGYCDYLSILGLGTVEGLKYILNAPGEF